MAITAAKKEQQRCKDASGKIVQKYREIYTYQARQQVADDEEDEKKVVNIRELRLQRRKKKEREKAKKVAARKKGKGKALIQLESDLDSEYNSSD